MEEVVRKAVVAAGKPPAVGWMSQTAHNRGCRGLVVGRGRCGSMLCPPHKFFQYSTATNKRRRGLLGQRKEPTDTFTTTNASATAASPFTGSRGFEELGLHHELVSALQRRLSPSLQCSPQPMPVQQRVLPLALKQEQQDLLVQAPTGSGKTLAYVLPALQLLRRLPETTASAAPSATQPSPLTNCSPFVLIMVPTRELCRQVYEELVALYQPQAASTRACVQLHGGVPYSVQEQILRSGNVKVVVGTPGRLLDHIERNNVDFHQVKLLVLDEADEMLCSEHHTIVSRIVTRELPRDRQTMMFSATLPEVVMDAAAKYTCPTACTRIAVDETSSKERKDVSSSAVGLYTEDTVLRVGWQHNLPPNVQHQAIPVDAGPASHQAVSDLLLFHGPKSAIVFTKTRSEADEVAKKLYENRFNVHMLHSDLKQEEREKCIELFRTGSITVLVATDLAGKPRLPCCYVKHMVQVANDEVYYQRS
ncbi:putative ATP-dependent RNA helicase YfmL, variant 3 [Balamuthia mandrillaris]